MTPRIPILVTSTDPYTLQRMEQDYDRYGGDKLVAKPLDIDVLLGDPYLNGASVTDSGSGGAFSVLGMTTT